MRKRQYFPTKMHIVLRHFTTQSKKIKIFHPSVLKSVYFKTLLIVSIVDSLIAQKDGTIELQDIASSDYDYLHPPRNSDGPLAIDININKLSVRSIDESGMTFSVTIELWQSWFDYRLKYPDWANTKYQVLDSSWISKIWTPKLYFINAVDGKLDNIITPSSFFWISDENKIYYCCRVILKLTCEMDLKYFPHDEQECAIQMGSSIYNSSEIFLEWRKDVNRSIQLLELQQYKIVNLEKSNFLKPLGQRYQVSCLQLILHLRRRTGYYLINVYIPTVLIVIMSMLTFWIPSDAVPARITLGVTSLLTIITKQYQAAMPNVSYVVALNVWLSSCIAFVFFSLLEFAAVIALCAGGTKGENTPQDASHLTLPMVFLRSNGTWSTKDSRSWSRKERPKMAPRRLDYFSRVFFPLAFIAFCVTYFKFYDG